MATFLLAGDDGTVPPWLDPLLVMITNSPRPDSTMRWLQRSTGVIIGFTARRNPATDDVDDAPAKYLNTTSTPAFDKSRDLYGLDPAEVRRIQAGARVVFVEGALDVLTGDVGRMSATR